MASQFCFMPDPRRQAHPERVTIDVWDIATATEADWAVLSPEERTRAAAFVHERHRIHYVAAHGGMRRRLGVVVGCAPGALAFETGPNGKPHFAGAGALPFNLSHTQTRAALACGQNVEVGVDIERVGSFDDALARRVLTEQERAVLSALPLAMQARQFFRFWTAKEAVLKALGVGLEIEPATMNLPILGEAQTWMIAVAGRDVVVVSYPCGADYVGAAAALAPEINIIVSGSDAGA